MDVNGMMRWFDKLLGLDTPPPEPRIDFTGMARAIALSELEARTSRMVADALKHIGQQIERRTITDKQLAKVQGLIKEDNPELSIAISELRQVLKNMRESDGKK